MSRYLIVIEKAKDNYAAYAPDLPGCVSTGATIDEAKQNMEEAIRGHIDCLKQFGEPVPEPQTIGTDYVEVA
jgi:predicted RNase H-like HicB family nuclease